MTVKYRISKCNSQYFLKLRIPGYVLPRYYSDFGLRIEKVSAFVDTYIWEYTNSLSTPKMRTFTEEEIMQNLIDATKLHLQRLFAKEIVLSEGVFTL